MRVDVQGRRVAGWVVELADRPPPRVAVIPITAVRGIGPPRSVVEIAKWASWRWAGALVFGLRTASSEKVVANLPPVARLGSRPPEHDSTVQGLATAAVTPAALSLLTTSFPEGRMRDRALGVNGPLMAGMSEAN